MVDRRQIVLALGAGVAAGLVSTLAGRTALAAATTRLLTLPLPRLDDPGRPSFEVFHRLSQWVTGRDHLDAEATRRLYPVFMAEPWGAKHIATAFSGLAAAFAETGGRRSAAELVAGGSLPEDETWFVSHLLTTWYLGIYYHETRTERVLNEQALMWTRVGAWARIRGVPSGTYADWTDVPETGR